MISAIVCIDENFGIGSNGDLLVHIPEDMKFFKEKTTNNVVIMGRKTYDSLPVKPLPNRTNAVVTSKINKPCEIDDNGVYFVSMDFIKEFLDILPRYAEEADCYIIGGGQIYKELLPYCKYAYVTKVYCSYNNVDTYFPNIENMTDWEIEYENEIKECNGVKYQFCTYRKKA